MTLLLIFGFGFATIVLATWFQQHFLVLIDEWLALSLPLLCSGLLLGFLITIVKKRITILRFRRIAPLFGLFLLALFIFNTEAFLIGLLPDRSPLIPLNAWASANGAFALRLGELLASFLVLTGVCSSLGQFFMKRPHIEDPTTDGGFPFLVSLAIGLCAMAIILHALGLFGWLNPTVIWVSVTTLSIKEWRSLYSLIRWLFGKAEWRLKQDYPILIILSLGLFLGALSLVETVRPDPTGYDDMTTYMNRAHIMSERQALMPLSYPFPFEILSAALRIATTDETLMFAMGFGVYALLFGVIIIYAFGRAVFDQRIGLIAAVITLSVPMASALAIREVKPDALLLPIATLFIWSLVRWIKESENRFLFTALFLLGFAMTIKLTALFLIAPLAFGLIVRFRFRGLTRLGWPTFRNCFLAAFFFFLPILSWTLAFPTIPMRPGEVPFSLPTLPAKLQKFPAGYTSSLSQDMSLLIDLTDCAATGSLEDFARFEIKRGSIASALFLPWDLTMNRQIGSSATESGPLFLALLPLGLVIGFSFFRSFRLSWRAHPSVLVVGFAITYGVLWLWFAKRVPWYGYPGIALLTLLVAVTERMFMARPFWHRFFVALLIIGLSGHALLWLKSSGQSGQIRYAGGQIDRLDYLEFSLPGYRTVTDTLNRQPESRIYVTGSRLVYGIHNNDWRALLDTRLDSFNCLAREDDPEKTLAALRRLQIRYVLFSRSLLQELAQDYPSTLRNKVVRFTDFAGEHLRVVWGSPDYLIFEVPAESK